MPSDRPPSVVRRHVSNDADAPARKRSRSDRRESAEPQPQPPGLIRSITLKNFMCHEHLKLELNSRITFLQGQNGSGKSAILTAVMVGLGARAATTDRGSSVKTLIRTNQKSAVVSITLDNSGENAFAGEKYGNFITIERTLRESGSGAYRISSERAGKLGPMQRGELVGILDGLSIQVDNPLVILTQETSKNFLRGEDPKKKYQLFLDATRLSHIERWYEKTRKNYAATKRTLGMKGESMKAREEEVKKLEREVTLHKNRENIKQKIETLKLNVLWAKVQEKENALEHDKQKQNEKEEEVRAIAAKRKKLEQKLQETGDLKERKAQLDRERAEEANRKDQLDKRLRELAAEQRKAAGKVKEAAARGREKVHERDGLQAEINRQRQETQPDFEAESQQRQQQVTALEAELTELTATEKTRDGHLKQVAGSLQKQREELSLGEEERRELDRKIKELEDQVKRCRASQANPRAVFGTWVAGVDRDIEAACQQRKFKKRPIGPVGAYVRVKAGCEEWKPLVETCLSGVLRAYLVDERADLPAMSAILKKHTQNEREKPRVIASKFLGEIHDISRLGIDTASGENVSVWSVLEIDNPVVANAVIDQARAESVLLLRTEAEARDKLAQRERVPRGCAQALTKAGFRYYPDPSYRTYPVNVPRQARYLQVSMEEVISDLSRQLQERRDDAQEAAGRLDPARAALQEGRRREEEARRQLGETRSRQNAVKRQLRELRSQEEPEPVNLQALEDEVKELDRIIAELSESVAPLKEQKNAIDQQVEECKKSQREAEEAVRAKIDQMEELRPELDAIGRHRTGLERLRAALDDRERQLAQLSEVVAEKEEQIRRATETAADAGQRTRSNKSVSELESRISGLTRSLQDDANRPQRSDDEAEREYQTAQLEYQRAREELGAHQKALQTISDMIKKRDQSLHLLRISLGSRVTTHFSTILEARNFWGGIKFDHERQRLEIEVSPGQLENGGGEQVGARATSQLSGGERSFSTIAFLMAMWNVVQSPFRMLDEYDVFMDDANRRIGHDMLVNNALELNSQFTFLTPLPIMGSHDGDNRVTIRQMKPPDRHR